MHCEPANLENTEPRTPEVSGASETRQHCETMKVESIVSQ